jgi:hypothetical protein
MLHRYLHFYFLFKNKVMDPKLLKKGRILGCRIHQDGQNLAELRRRLPRGNCRCRMTQVFILNHRKCQLYSFLVSDKKTGLFLNCHKIVVFFFSLHFMDTISLQVILETTVFSV